VEERALGRFLKSSVRPQRGRMERNGTTLYSTRTLRIIGAIYARECILN
jgi:hypothetical protein